MKKFKLATLSLVLFVSFADAGPFRHCGGRGTRHFQHCGGQPQVNHGCSRPVQYQQPVTEYKPTAYPQNNYYQPVNQLGVFNGGCANGQCHR